MTPLAAALAGLKPLLDTPALAKVKIGMTTRFTGPEACLTWAVTSPKGNELANLAAEGLGEVIAAAWQGIERIRAAWHLPYSFLRHCGLSVS